ncbi:MAG: adenosylcobalamin-dependent ribonucleoside-diphosphate reductase [Bacteroidetes bacterium]|nr:adenosylcobalamin-dependent ribonucleoside-diphosphate reductase [Bacteroidota bacterium]
MKINRKYTKQNINPYDLFEYDIRYSILRNPNGSVVFEMNNVEVPSHWSHLASDILAQKYFRKSGVPQVDAKGHIVKDENGKAILGGENSIKQVVHRLAGTWTDWGKRYDYFDTEEDASAFYDEVVYMLLNQMAAPNSPQWFNTGLFNMYGIKGNKQGHYFVQNETGKTCESQDAYSRPQTSACFIQSIDDDLVNEGGLFDLLCKEARIFKYGSGTGTNFSKIRGASEQLSGGGVSSGLMSFLKVFDRAAGAIKSGGTTRRAAKMVILDIDHPDVEDFIEWKSKEEDKVASLVAGSKVIAKFMQEIIDESVVNGYDPNKNKKLKVLIQKALNRGVPLSTIKKALDLVSFGFTKLDFTSYDVAFEGEAYLTVSGQNSNNSIRVTNDFIKAVEEDDIWELRYRKNGEVSKVVRARDLFEKINISAWISADPGIQFDTTINEWNTCPRSGRINASNPCSEYMFLDDSACNLASINLIKFWDTEKQTFLIDEYKHAIYIWTIVLEISVLMAQFPSKRIAELSYEYRTLGLGYTNFGSLLMVAGIPYDSPQALAITGALSSLLTSEAYSTSALLARQLGTFSHYEKNKEDMLRVIRNHRNAVYNVSENDYEQLTIKPIGIDANYCPDYLLKEAQKSWDNTLELANKYGFRNAQVTVLAPTGTIALVMDCDTTGIEPDFAIVKYKKLAGGGYFKIVNKSVKIALQKLGYTEEQIYDIEKYTLGYATLNYHDELILENCPEINTQTLKDRGITKDIIANIDQHLKDTFDIRFAFNKFSISESLLHKLGIAKKDIDDSNTNFLSLLGFTEEQIEIANNYVCGTMMLEGAPHIATEHLPIFDCASKCGKSGTRFISHMAHIRIMAAAQPFITGAISKTVNMPANATVDEIYNVYMTAWKMMLKSIAIYRDGSKLSQPLNSSMLDGLNEVVTLGDENTLDETLGPKEMYEMLDKRLTRRRLPNNRRGRTREAKIGGQKIFLRTGEYDDGTAGEIFLDMYKEGAAFRGMLNSFAILTSKALQYGVPLEELVDTFIFTKFEPQGIVQGHEAVKYASSILDYVFRSLGYDYLGRTDFVQEKPKYKEATSDATKKAEINTNNTNGYSNTQNDNIQNKKSNVDLILEQAGVPIEEENSPSLFEKNNIGTYTSIDIYNAKTMGYTGEQCTNCSSIRVKRNGTCLLCEDCGTTSGCS